MELDARTAADGLTLSADVCVVGAGPVGLALALALGKSGKYVLVLESAGRGADPASQELNAGDTTGDPYPDLRLARHRAVGGTSVIWNTMVGGAPYAKLLPLDDLDFEPRDWLSNSGWPIRRAALEPYYRGAERLIGLRPFDYEAHAWSAGRGPVLDLPQGSLTSAIYQFGPAERFGRSLPAEVAASAEVTLAHAATVTELVLAPGREQVTQVRWTTLSGNGGIARATTFVLAAGGIENARLLLLAGMSHAWLGRGFMEHPVDSSLQLVTRNPALFPAAGFYGFPSEAVMQPVMGRIGLSPELLRSERITNASLRLIPEHEPAVLRSASLRPAARRLVPFPRLRKMIGSVIRGVGAATRGVTPARYRLLIDLEQGPHPENRIALSHRKDRFDRPLAALSWRWTEVDQAHRVRIREVIARELEGARVGRVLVGTEESLDPNSHHQLGATRMHFNPHEGVVDEHLRVHGLDNLYVAGSSVFPAGGFANPTLTSLALALRLADRLAEMG